MSQFNARPPAVSTVLIDDARSRVTRWDFEPGADTGWHRHGMAYVVVPMTDLTILIDEPAGQRRVDVARGAVYTRDEGVEHNVINAGDVPMSFIEIEFKR